MRMAYKTPLYQPPMLTAPPTAQNVRNINYFQQPKKLKQAPQTIDIDNQSSVFDQKSAKYQYLNKGSAQKHPKRQRLQSAKPAPQSYKIERIGEENDSLNIKMDMEERQDSEKLIEFYKAKFEKKNMEKYAKIQNFMKQNKFQNS